MPVYEAAGAGSLLVAERGRRRGDDFLCPAQLSALGSRLAPSAGDVASDVGLRMAADIDSIALVSTAAESLPSDLAAAHAMILAERDARHRRGQCSGRQGRSGQCLITLLKNIDGLAQGAACCDAAFIPVMAMAERA